MRIHKRVPFIFICCFFFTGLLSSCYKKDIQVGNELAESHTRIITVDTVSVVFSSYVLDSFATSGNNFALVGNYNDAYVGNTTASTFFQPGLPTLSEDVTTLLPKSAVYDSIQLIMRPSGYYYGDTTKPFSITVNELAEQTDYTYNNLLYNTSNFPVKSTPLATWSNTISPARRDSVKIRLPNAMGQDLYTKLQTKANQVSNETLFLDYFRGINVRPSNSTGAAVYGFNLADSSVRMRLHYHLTIPYKVDKTIDFILTRSTYQFNRIISDRSSTPLQPTFTGQHEFFSSNTNPYSMTQGGTGVYLKVKFPSLRSILKIDEVVRLMDAKLVLKPVKGTYDYYINKLPNPLHLATTDASNLVGSSLVDTTGSGIMYRSPFIDDLYGINTTYTFNISSYINYLLNTSGVGESGFFIIQDVAQSAKQINRGVFGSRENATYETKLVLNLLTIE
jgi:hypothetical protein